MNKEIVKKYNKNYTTLVVLTLSLGLLIYTTTTAIQPSQILVPANAENTNATQQAKSTANQTGEKAQAGAANVSQQGKAAANQTGEKMQAGATNATQQAKSGASQAGQTGQSIMNKTGETLQKINPFK